MGLKAIRDRLRAALRRRRPLEPDVIPTRTMRLPRALPPFIVEQDPKSLGWSVRNRNTGEVVDTDYRRVVCEMKADQLNDQCRRYHQAT